MICGGCCDDDSVAERRRNRHQRQEEDKKSDKGGNEDGIVYERYIFPEPQQNNNKSAGQNLKNNIQTIVINKKQNKGSSQKADEDKIKKRGKKTIYHEDEYGKTIIRNGQVINQEYKGVTKTIKTAVEKYICSKDPQLGDILKKIANRDFSKLTSDGNKDLHCFHKDSFVIKGYESIYILTDNGKSDGRIIEIGRICNSIKVPCVVYYLVQRNEELYGEIKCCCKGEKDNGKFHAEGQSYYNGKFYYDGKMHSLVDKNEYLVLKPIHVDHLTFQERKARIGRVCDYIHQYHWQAQHVNKQRFDICYLYKTSDNGKKNHFIKFYKEDGTIVIGDKDANKRYLMFLDNSYRNKNVSLVQCDGCGNYCLPFVCLVNRATRDTEKEREINMYNPYDNDRNIQITFNTKRRNWMPLSFKNDKGEKKTLESDEDLMQFDKQLRSVIVEKWEDRTLEEQATYEFLLKMFDLYGRVMEINKKKQNELQNAEEKKSAGIKEEDEKSNKSENSKNKKRKKQIVISYGSDKVDKSDNESFIDIGDEDSVDDSKKEKKIDDSSDDKRSKSSVKPLTLKRNYQRQMNNNQQYSLGNGGRTSSALYK